MSGIPKLFFLLIFICIPFFGMAIPAVDLVSPVDGQIVNIGEEILIKVNSEVEFNSIHAITHFLDDPDEPMDLLFFLDGMEPTKSYETTVNTAFFPEGLMSIEISIHPVDGAVNYYYASAEILLVSELSLLEGSASVVRVLPKIGYAGGLVSSLIFVKPNSNFPGIIVNENFPQGPELLFLNQLKGTSQMDGQMISNADGNIFKIVLMEAPQIADSGIRYIFTIPQDVPVGTQYTFLGDWAIEGETGEVIGNNILTVGDFQMPECPFTDQQLLAQITKWSIEEIDNFMLLQIIEKWVDCAGGSSIFNQPM